MAHEVKAVRCPGWTGVNGVVHPCGGHSVDANLLEWKIGNFRTVQQVDPETGATRSVGETFDGPDDMCSRCRRQKAKYDEEHGERERRQAEDRERYAGLIRRYAEDLNLAIIAPAERGRLGDLVLQIESLESRWSRPPYERRSDIFRGVPGEMIYVAEKWEVLRFVLGLSEIEGVP